MHRINLILMFSLISISSKNLIFMWINMEMVSIVFMWTMSLVDSNSSIISYFLINSIASVIIFTPLILKNIYVDLNMFIFLKSFLLKLNFNFSFLLKLGILPFHSWVFVVSKGMKWKSLFFFFSILKITPIWGLFLSMNIHALVLLLSVNLTILPFIFFKGFSLFYILSFSSMLNSVWIMISIFISANMSLIYTMFYFTSTIQIILSTKFNCSFFLNKWILISICWLIGFPPTPLFFIKLSILKIILSFDSMIFIFLLLIFISNLLSSINYMMMFTLSSLGKENFINSNIWNIFTFISIPSLILMF